MLSWTLLTLVAVAPPTGFTVSVERLPVTRTHGVVMVTVDPLMAKVAVHGGTISKPVRLCPKLERTADGTVLTCSSRRLWAEIVPGDKGAVFLDLRELTGVSWLDVDLIPIRAWALRSVLLPDACPGTLAAARGECALGRGELDVAKEAWNECLATPDSGLCHLRLGDLAIRQGQLEEALAHYGKVSTSGPVGRMAKLRTCELVGTCLAEKASLQAADVSALGLDMAREVKLLSVRRELAAGRDARALQQLLQGLERDLDLCEGVLPFCQKLISVGLQSADADARMAALSVFLSDKTRRGPAEYELNLAASAAAKDLGAPAFAASVLASNTPRVPRVQLGEHLLQIVDLYLAAKDPVRAGVVLEYAEGKLGSAATHAGPWARARKQLGRRPAPRPEAPLATSPEALEALSSDVALSTDLARAAALRSKAAAAPAPQSVPENAP